MVKMIGIIERFGQNGVLHRDEVKNDMELISRLMYHGYVRRIHRAKKVYYELTERALPILEQWRKVLIEETKIMAELTKPPSVFHALLDDVRFLDNEHEAAKHFKFLGDWQLKRPVVGSQLELAKMRYYQHEVQTK